VYTECPKCGAKLPDPGRDFKCGKCGSIVKTLGATFVDDDEGLGPIAAIQLSDEPRWKAILRALQSMARLVAMVLLLVVLFLCIGALVFGIPVFYQGAPGSELGAPIYLLAPAPVVFLVLTGPAFLAYYGFLVVAILASFGYLVWSERRPLVRQVVNSIKEFMAPPRKEGHGFIQVPQLFLAVLFFDLMYAWGLAGSGTQTSSPDFGAMPQWYLLYTFANASVYEELAARTLLLGLPLLLAYMFAYIAGDGTSDFKEYIKSKCSRGLKGFVLGGGFKMGVLEAFFIAGSAAMFGLAHVSGWDMWKIIPTFVAGLAFGYLFLKVGIHAAIILHFSFDYLSMAYSLVPGFYDFEILLIFVWFIVGAFYFVHYIWQIGRWLGQRIADARAPATALPPSKRGIAPSAVAAAAESPYPAEIGNIKRDDLVDIEGRMNLQTPDGPRAAPKPSEVPRFESKPEQKK
jgi:hypothetical protein